MILGDHTYLGKNKVDPEGIDPDIKYIGLEHIGEGTLSLNGFGYASDVNSSKAVFEKGDILFGKLRPYFRKVIIAPFDGICSTDIWVVKPKNGIDRNFLFYWMASQDFVDEVTRSSEGTRMPRAKWEIASKIEIPDVDIVNQKKIGEILHALDQKIHLNQQTTKRWRRWRRRYSRAGLWILIRSAPRWKPSPPGEIRTGRRWRLFRESI
jgi:type I restriction enzyme S subunit